MARQGPVTVTDHNKEDPKHESSKELTYADLIGNPSVESMFSPRFKSVVAMAGWDEEALLIATLVVEDTPDREMKHKRRPELLFKTPPTNSRRKRRNQRKSPMAIPITILNLDDDEEITKEDSGKKKAGKIVKDGVEEKKIEEKEMVALKSLEASCSSSSIPCMDKLREELSCAICLEICFEPSTTPCGHSFCKKCLRSAADKCGKKCPKCRQLISNGRSCTVNTVLWNTIQLLFPQEIEARKAASSPPSNSRESDHHGRERNASNHNYAQNRNLRSTRAPSSSTRVITLGSRRETIPHQSYEDHRRIRPITRVSSSRESSSERRRRIPSQNEDAAMALRLQREEFMEAFRANNNEQAAVGSISLARDNLRAMASRAMNIRLQNRPM